MGLCFSYNISRDRETGYEGGGRRWELWWIQTADRKQLSATLKEILAATRERRWKSGRRGRGGGGERESEESEEGTGRDGSRDDGTETGDAKVGELYCVAARRKYTGE